MGFDWVTDRQDLSQRGEGIVGLRKPVRRSTKLVFARGCRVIRHGICKKQA
jgi:hypothetical protein